MMDCSAAPTSDERQAAVAFFGQVAVAGLTSRRFHITLSDSYYE